MKKFIGLTKHGLMVVGEFNECLNYLRDCAESGSLDEALENVQWNEEHTYTVKLKILFDKFLNTRRSMGKVNGPTNDDESAVQSAVLYDEFIQKTGLSHRQIDEIINRYHFIKEIEIEPLYTLTVMGVETLREYLQQLDTLAELTHIDNPDAIEESICNHMGEYGKGVIKIREMSDEMQTMKVEGADDFNLQYCKLEQSYLDKFGLQITQMSVDEDMLDKLINKWQLVKLVDNNIIDEPQ